MKSNNYFKNIISIYMYVFRATLIKYYTLLDADFSDKIKKKIQFINVLKIIINSSVDIYVRVSISLHHEECAE